jgi:imidazolonepropionase-like amidohydrolase
MEKDSVILAGRLIQPHTGTVSVNQRIHVRGDSIVAIGPSEPLPENAELLDLSAMTVLPGLIDCHTHLTLLHESKDPIDELKRSPAQCALQAIPNVRMKLMSGFTTVREAGSYWAFVDVALRDAIARGDVVGPTMLVPGAMITMTGGAGALTGIVPEVRLPRELRFGKANSPAQIRERVRAVIHYGADVVKIFSSGAVLQHGNNNPSSNEFTLEELSAAVEEARSLGVRVMAHAHSAAGIKNAVLAGVASIEHGTMIDEQSAALMADAGTYLVPTLSVSDCMGESSQRPADFLAKARHALAHHRTGFEYALRAGVKIPWDRTAWYALMTSARASCITW